MYDVAKNLHEVLDQLPKGVRLVAISKFHPKEYLSAAYVEGQRILERVMSRNLPRRWQTCPKT